MNIESNFYENIYKNVNGIWILQERFSNHNQILNNMLTFLAKKSAGETTNKIDQITYGTSTVRANRTQTISNMTETYTKSIETNIEYPAYNKVLYTYTLLPEEHNGYNITEYALTLTDGSIVTRIVRGLIEKKSDIRLDGTWELTFNI